MLATPVLIVTHDDALWQHWRGVDASSWLPARGQGLSALNHWRDQGRGLAILDAGLPALPSWTDPSWPDRLRGLRLVIGSVRPNDEEGRRALAAGASAYVHAYSPAPVLDRILRSVNSGDVWLGRSLLTRLLKDIEQRLPPAGNDWMQGLTNREKEVARHVAIGKSNQEIADVLGISERTVRAHLSAVFEKLGVTDRLLLALKVHGIQ